MADTRAALLEVQELIRTHRYSAARTSIDALLERDGASVEGWLLKAQLSLQAGELETAMRAVEQARQLAPDAAAIHFTRGRIHRARGEHALAADAYREALAARPDDADLWTSLGVALRALGRDAEAVAAYREALRLSPAHLQARANLANALAALGEAGPAAALRADARAEVERRIGELSRRARHLQDTGRGAAALEILRQVVSLAPEPATLLWAAGLASDCGDMPQALDLIDRLLSLDPGDVRGLKFGCLLCAGAGVPERLSRYAEALRARAPAEPVELLAALALPAILESSAAIAGVRARYEAALDRLLERAPGADNERWLGTWLVGVQAFFLAYHGRCDRDLQMKAARLWQRLIPSLGYTSDHVGRPRPPGRIKVGFISRYFSAHSIGKTSRGLIEQLDRSRFEVHVIFIRTSDDDEVTHAIRRAAEHAIDIGSSPADLDTDRRRLAALELDILFYQDIGMEPVSYFLAFARLARVQCVSYGHPDTSGIPALDYFVSNDLYETPQSSEHYSEKLFLLRNLPTLAYYHRPAAPVRPATRGALGLPEAGTLYVCPQTLFKIHPDFDAALRAILERDPSGWLVLIRGQYYEWSQQLTARLRRTLPGVLDRVLLLNSLPPAGFMQLLTACDVMLDTWYFNGMNSSLEALAVGLPIVTWPTELQRGRHTRAMYLKLGIEDCVAATPEEYVDIAVRLGRDRELRADLKGRILERNHLLYEDGAVVREFERFFETALGAALAPH